MRIKKAIIVGLVLPLVSEICSMSAGAVTYMTTASSRPSTTARMPTLSYSASSSTSSSTTSTNAGLLATCANPLPDRLTSGRCIDRYDSCLRQDNVCGEHFELCYNLKQFNKSRIMCQEYLAQCPAEAVKAIFGNSVTTSNDLLSANRTMCDGESLLTKRTFSPALGDIGVAADSRIDLAIKEGKNWAAANSVKTCNKIADACIQNACKKSPQKCISLDGFSDIDASEMVNIATSGETTLRINADMLTMWLNNMAWDGDNVKNYIKEQCRDTVGSNEWCFMVTNGTPAKEVDLTDSFNIQEVYQDIMYNGVGARWKMAQSKIKEWAALATKKSVEQCKDAMTDCAVNACGEGSKARCYGLAKDGNTVSIKNKAGSDITGQCENLIENNQYCKDVFRNKDTGEDGDVWAAVWTEDLMGAIVGLDSDLQKAFNEAAVAQMRSSCQAQAEKCVESECGTDFSRCFITSIEAKKNSSVSFSEGSAISSNLYAGGFDEVLARNLCMLKIKKYTDCIDYFDVQYAKATTGTSADSWGTSSNVRNAWLDAANSDSADKVCRVSETYIDQVDESGNAVDTTKKLAPKVKTCATQERSIFDGLLSDISKRANSVLEREANDLKNACENSNAKGSTGKNYIWAALSDLDSSDEYDGFSDVTATSNPFDGFCAVKVTIRSNNSKVNDALGSDKYMYYPKGTSMQCLGLTTSELEKVERAVASDVNFCGKGETASTGGCVEKLSGLQKTLRIGGATIAGVAVGGLGGTLAGNALGNATTKSSKLSAADTALYADCQSCFKAGGKGYSGLQACVAVDDPDNPDATEALAKCNNKISELQAKRGTGKKSGSSGLLNMSSTGGKIGAIAGAGLGGLAGGLLAGNAIKENADTKLEDARQQAIADFNANTDINCYINGKKVASYGQDMIVK
ncbi:MAG: hypothetical protein WC137_00215 [Alphaproteobacteria bacterium]